MTNTVDPTLIAPVATTTAIVAAVRARAHAKTVARNWAQVLRARECRLDRLTPFQREAWREVLRE